MARGDIRQRISLDGGEEVRRQLQQIGASGEKALRELSAATSGASTSLAGVSNAARDMQLVFGRMGGLGGAGGFSAITTAAAGMTTAVGATIAVVAAATAGLVALAVSGADAASEIKEGAIRVGVAADDYTKLKFAFEQSGSSAEGFEKAMAIILDAAGDAAKAAEKAADDIEKANEKITQSSIAAGEEAKKRSRDLAQAILGNQQTLSKDLGQIAIEEGRAIAALTAKPLTEREAIEKQFAERRADAARAAAEREAEIRRKADQDAREAAIKRNREQAAELAAFNKTVEDAANKAVSPFEKLGVTLTNAAGNAKDPANAFRDIAEAVGKIEDPAQRAAKVIELFGRRVGGQMVESLSEGRIGLDALGKEAERLGLKFDAADLKIGKSFQDTVSKLGNTASATAAKVGLAFAGGFDEIGEALAAAFGHAQGPIVDFAKAAADLIKPIFADIANAISGDTDKINSQFIVVLIPTVKLFGQAFVAAGVVIKGFFEILAASFGEIAGLINEVFGIKVTAGDIPAFGAAIYLAVKALGVLATAFTALTVAASPWLLLLGGVALAIGAMLLPIDTLKTGLAVIFGPETTASIIKWVEDFRAGAQQLYDTFLGTIQGIKDIWNNAWTAMIDFVVAGFERLVAKAVEAGAAIRDAISGGTGPGGSSESDRPLGLAGGGHIRGPGTGTSDSILARLSNNEYVIRSAAVKHFGVGFFDALNRLRSPQFALGGLVDALSTSLVPRSRGFRSGGLVAAGSSGRGGTPVYLQIHGGKAVGPMIADRDVLGALHREAKRARVFSAGPAPSSIG